MKKIGLILLLFICSNSILMAVGCQNDSDSGTTMDEFKITATQEDISNHIFEEGCIRDEFTARDIAASIFKAVYGESYDNGLPLLIDYDETAQTWLVKTQLPEGTIGGSKHIVIKRSNGEIIGIWVTK